MAPDFQRALVEADSELASMGMSPAVEARLRGRLGASLYSRRTWWRYPAVALAACTAGVLLAFFALAPKAPPKVLAGMKLEAASPSFVGVEESGDVVVRTGEATFRADDQGSTVKMTRPGRLRREPRGLRVVSGRVELEVQKRPAAAEPMRVLVSHGELEVHGTRFSVDQLEGGGGAALLFEGKILFRAPDGREIVLSPGQSVAWPLPPPKDESFTTEREEDALAPLPAPPLADAGAADWSAHDRLLRAHTLLDRIPRLRDQGKNAQAAAELEVAMKQDLPAAARERLSFELIDIYANELWNNELACRQVKDHAWRYPAGRYEDEIVRIREEAGCNR